MSAADARGVSIRANARRLPSTRAVIVVSASTANILIEDYDVPPELITVACPGTDRGAMAQGSSDGIVRLLSVGAVVPRKGFDVLIAALAALPESAVAADDCGRPHARRAGCGAARCRASCATGSPIGSNCWARCRPKSSKRSMPAPICSCWRRASRATAWPMPKPSRTACRWSAPRPAPFPTPCRPSAGVLVEPNDVKALTRTLRMLIENPKERQWLASGARAAAAGLPTWRGSGRDFCRRDRGGWHERIFRGVARVARAVRSPRAKRDGARCGCRHICRPSGRRRSSISPAAPGSTLRALSPLIKARQTWRLVDNDLSLLARTPQVLSPQPHRHDSAGRSQPRSRGGARRSGRTGHDLGAARSRFGRLAGTPGGRGRGAAAAGLCGAELRRPRSNSTPSIAQTKG